MKKPSLDVVVNELQKRKQAPFVLEEFLFDKQLQFVKDPSPFKVAVTSRRSGKTVGCAADLVDSCLKEDGVTCLYITLSRNNAKKLVWREIKLICRKFKIKVKFNESDLSAEFPNASMIYCSGASDKGEIEKFRGLALKKVYIDECQSFPSYIEDLIDEVLAPALMDYAGSLSLIGTPGPIPTGFFFNASRSQNWSSYKWTFWDNPHIARKSGKNHQALFDRELARRGADKTTPSIQREWFGEWVLDVDSLVFKYDPKKNDYKEIPKLTNFVMGVDLGFDDSDAICVLGWNDKDKTTYLVEELITPHQGITELVNQIEEIKSRWDISKIVIDTAGLGKKIGEELTRRYKITLIPAEKSRKLEYIELLNDSLRTGQLRARVNSRFAEDCMKVEWDVDRSTSDKRFISKRFHSDICDSVLYAWRESYSFTHEPALNKPVHKWGSHEWAQEEMKRIEEQAQEHFEKEAEIERAWEDGSEIWPRK